MNFGEEGGRAFVGGLIAPHDKTLVQPAARWLLSGDHWLNRDNHKLTMVMLHKP